MCYSWGIERGASELFFGSRNNREIVPNTLIPDVSNNSEPAPNFFLHKCSNDRRAILKLPLNACFNTGALRYSFNMSNNKETRCRTFLMRLTMTAGLSSKNRITSHRTRRFGWERVGGRRSDPSGVPRAIDDLWPTFRAGDPDARVPWYKIPESSYLSLFPARSSLPYSLRSPTASRLTVVG